MKIVGENTPLHAQGYFVYDSRKAGSVTTSHVRFSPRPIKGSYLVHRANFVACHQFHFLERIDMLSMADPGATFLLNSPYGPDQVWDHLPVEVQRQIIDKKLKFYVVDAYHVAREADMGVRINTIMQTCFFKLAGVIPADEAITQIKDAIKKTYGKKGGEKVVEQNNAAVDARLGGAARGEIPEPGQLEAAHGAGRSGPCPGVRQGRAGHDDRQPGRRPARQRLALRRHLPHGHHAVREAEHRPGHPHLGPEDLHAVRALLAGLPTRHDPHEGLRPGPAGQRPGGLQVGRLQGQGVPRLEVRGPGGPRRLHRLRPVRRRLPGQGQGEGQAQGDRHGAEAAAPRRRAGELRFLHDAFPTWTAPRSSRTRSRARSCLLPLFEFSGACAGCGETPYVKLLTQFFGDRMLIGNATGCSSIYGGNLPCTPYTVNHEGRGPAWSNSLFEDCAEFGLGFRLAIDQQIKYAHELLRRLSGAVGRRAGRARLIDNKQETEEEIAAQRARVAELNKRLPSIGSPDAKNLLASSDYLIRKSVWSFGGDGWAYDIGFGGMDHVFASGRDVNILVLDTEVYSNTGGQASKSTFRGAVAKFAAGGKGGRKKDLGMIAMSYGNVFVGSISMGANPMHAIRTIRAAESYRGTSLLIAFSHCIGWGIDMAQGMNIQKDAVACGYWPLYSFDPRERVASVPVGQQEAGGRVQGLCPEGGPLRHVGPLASRTIRPGCWHLASRTSTRGTISTSSWPAWTGRGGRGGRTAETGGNGETKAKGCQGGGSMSVDLSTTYLGLKLKNPAGDLRLPAERSIDQSAAAGSRPARPRPFALAVRGADRARRGGNDQGPRVPHRQFRRIADLLSRAEDYRTGPEEYLETIAKAKKAVKMPIIASLNGASRAAGSAMRR